MTNTDADDGAMQDRSDGNAPESAEQPDAPNMVGDGKPDFLIVGIGASAGGLEALERFFDAMPSDSGLAFVVVQHLSPDYKSLMADLLAKHTEMPVSQASDGTEVEPGRIYLIPPKNNLTIYHGRLLLAEQDADRHNINLPIDIFFRSLAQDAGERSVGIILSGTGSDGMRGIRAVKEAGGIVMVQEESTAKFDGMPRSAISTGIVDYVLSPDEMPEQLLQYIEHPRSPSRPRVSREKSEEDTLAKVLATLRRQTGVDFGSYKPSTVLRRIDRRMSVNHVESLEEYLRYIDGSPRESSLLFKELLIGVTNFFRDPSAYDNLREKAIRPLIARTDADDSLRAWVAGCSTGEEAYSLAMLLLEEAGKADKRLDIKIFATDIDQTAVEFASNGVYPESIAADVSSERLSRFFIKKGESYQVTRQLRESVIFATQNILRDPPFTKIDLLSCRNLLIYLKPAFQKKVLTLFSFSLKQNGFLFLGTSESVGDLSAAFESLDTTAKVYRNRATSRAGLTESLQLPTLHDRIDRRGLEPDAFRIGRTDPSSERVYEALLADYVPPCTVVDEQFDILHVFGDITPYMRLPSGRASLNVLKMARGDISASLATALHKTRRDNNEVVYSKVVIGGGEDGSDLVNIRVKPIQDKSLQGPLFMVFFESVAPEPSGEEPTSAEVYDAGEASNRRMGDLEQELQYTRENLQATIEELETSNEELQATNEELLASNEELQSTNEELQSVNEELYTVNAEYQSKIQELTDLNSDMENLLLSTDVGTLFLDEDLRIRKFTPPVATVLNLLHQDVGRPVDHISHALRYDGFLADARAVLEGRGPVEHEIMTEDDRWILLEFRPYQTQEGSTIGGVVITFIDITRIKQAEVELRRERDLLDRIMATTFSAVTVVDREGVITFANRRAETLLGLTKDELTERTYDDPEWKITAVDGSPFPEEKLPFVRVMATGETLEDVRHAVVRPDGTTIHLSINAGPLYDENANLDGMVSTMRELLPEEIAEMTSDGDS